MERESVIKIFKNLADSLVSVKLLRLIIRSTLTFAFIFYFFYFLLVMTFKIVQKVQYFDALLIVLVIIVPITIIKMLRFNKD